MQPQPTKPQPVEATAARGVLVAGGYGVRISVWHGRLVVEDGIGTNRRSRLLHRATSGLKRLVVLGHTGYVSLEAIRWLADLKAGYLQIDADGRVLAAFGPPGTDRPKLRRAQAMATGEAALALSRWLVDAKLAAQTETLQQFARLTPVDDGLAAVAQFREALAAAGSVDELRVQEAWAAGAYWQALAPLEVRFAGRDVDRVPTHWRTFGGRSSPLAQGPRLAANPANATINYLYALVEAEAILACRIVGLDPGLGVMHADLAFRDSLAADVMEPVRPLVDRYAFELISSRPFAARDFFETRVGVCRVTPPLTHELAATIPHWGRLVGAVVEDLARALDPEGINRRGSSTPITGRRRASGRPTGREFQPASTKPIGMRSCSRCGSPVKAGRKTCSQACCDEIQAEVHARFAATSAERMRGFDRTNHPGLTAEANQKRSETRRGQRLAELAWEKEHSGTVDRERFAREVAPKLAGVSASALARATGLSVGHWAKVKKGERVPHPRWWDLLRASVGVDAYAARQKSPLTEPSPC